jgi:predicted phosphodiesterase
MPGKSAVEKALDRALRRAKASPRSLELETARYIVFSDHHKGKHDGADDFLRCERAYLGALKHYAREGYTLVVLGDAEELWECQPKPVLRAYANILELERRFFPDRYLRVWGNHDDEWESPRRVRKHLWQVYSELEVHEALYFEVTEGDTEHGALFLVHGHQGSFLSDRLAGVTKLVVRFVWRTVQRLTRKPSTTPATDACLRNKHDKAMYDWAAQQSGIVTVAGHTHRPVFNSKTHLQQLEEELAQFLELPLNQADGDHDARVPADRSARRRATSTAAAVRSGTATLRAWRSRMGRSAWCAGQRTTARSSQRCWRGVDCGGCSRNWTERYRVSGGIGSSACTSGVGCRGAMPTVSAAGPEPLVPTRAIGGFVTNGS